MTIKAFIQKDFLQPNDFATLCQHLSSLGYEIDEFEPDDATLAGLKLDPDTFIFGMLWVMCQLAGRAGVSEQFLPSYPKPLHAFLHRDIWEGPVRDLPKSPARHWKPVFVKVAQMRDRADAGAFASELVSSTDAIARHFANAPDRRVLCAQPVHWLSEWRAYVSNGALAGISLYRPDFPDLNTITPEILIDFDVVEQAIHRMQDAGQATAGYSLDFGTLGTGQTALIEANDGIGLANYALDVCVHADLHRARWRELMSMATR